MKLNDIGIGGFASLVAPLVGAWIEIKKSNKEIIRKNVAPLVGAWIEIIHEECDEMAGVVAPLVGAWIEINIHITLQFRDKSRSSCRSVD